MIEPGAIVTCRQTGAILYVVVRQDETVTAPRDAYFARWIIRGKRVDQNRPAHLIPHGFATT